MLLARFDIASAGRKEGDEAEGEGERAVNLPAVPAFPIASWSASTS